MIDWNGFLLKAMDSFGFNVVARDLIYRNFCNIWYSFRINGESTGNIRSFRGVRQGDSLSPFLFVLAQQVLTVNLNGFSKDRSFLTGNILWNYCILMNALPGSSLM